MGWSGGIFQPEFSSPAVEGMFQPEIMQMQGHISAQHYANAGACLGPKLCKCKGCISARIYPNLGALFQPEIMPMYGHLPGQHEFKIF